MFTRWFSIIMYFNRFLSAKAPVGTFNFNNEMTNEKAFSGNCVTSQRLVDSSSSPVWQVYLTSHVVPPSYPACVRLLRLVLAVVTSLSLATALATGCYAQYLTEIHG